MIRRIAVPPFEALDPLLPQRAGVDADTRETVAAVLADVQGRGDEAVREYARRFDGVDLAPSEWEVGSAGWQGALERVSPAVRAALARAVDRVREYHQHQREEGFHLATEDGSVVGMKVTPLDRVGLYVPGGKASYPSSVVMNAMPALVAGVREIVVVVPPQGVTDLVLAACALSGVTRVFRIGGAQAVGALAFGTATVPRVDKIVGPGNRWVAEAKRQVVGRVGIDMIAGPTEVLIVADGTASPGRIAADMIAQAEHDEDATSWCVTTDPAIADALPGALEAALSAAPRAAIARAALERNGLVIVVPSMREAIEVANRRAPEHLEILADGPERIAGGIRHAGAIFLGDYSPEPVGDYMAGPSHVLPTGGTARYASPLGVYDFVKRSSIIRYSEARLAADAAAIIALAEAEGLHGHAEAVRMRVGGVAARRGGGGGGSSCSFFFSRLSEPPRPAAPLPRLKAVLALTTVFMVIEALGGWISGSLALLADAGHMLTDVGALTLSLLTAWVAQRPRDDTKTYGYLRWEILAALVNGVALFGIAAWVVVEAIQRIQDPQPIRTGIFLAIACAGLVVNLASLAVLHSAREGSLNVRGAYLHVLGDALGSVGAVVAAGIIALTGWTLADPIVSILLSVLILVGAARLLRESTDILLESVPRHVSMAEVHRRILAVPGVAAVHDLHVWTVTSGMVAMSGHAVVPDLEAHPEVLDGIRAEMSLMGIGHVTIQLEVEHGCEGCDDPREAAVAPLRVQAGHHHHHGHRH